MHRRLFKKRKSGEDVMDKLLTAVVSVYLYMARTAKLKGEEINFIDRILHSMFGNDIPLYKIEQARQQVLSIREAANYLNVHLGSADRSKIILNLISLAYHDRSKIHVLGSLEIVELTDLLRLDVSSLDSIYSLFEGKTDTVELPAAVFSSEKSVLRNSMLWAPQNADLKYLGSDAKSSLFFIMIESLVLLSCDYGGSTKPCRILEGEIQRHLEPHRFYRLKEESVLIIPGAHGDIRMQTTDLWFLYDLGNSPRSIALPENAACGKLNYRNRRFYLESGSKRKQIRELALDEIPCPDTDQTVFHLLREGDNSNKLLLASIDYILCKDKTGLTLKTESSSSALLKLHYAEGQLTATRLDGDIFINRILLQDSTQFILNQDIISFGDTNYLINRNWELIEIPIQIGEICVSEISHSFGEGNIALSSIAFRIPKGSMMAIMGPSGSGKTTLLQILLGDIKASHSRISIDGMDFYANYTFFQKHIGYVPQDDLLFPNLTVYENLLYRIRLALPTLKNKTEIRTRIENLLHSVGLYEQRHMLVGDVLNKKLSGGQRRRLNIALELVLNPMIIILDEPTSGLSSKDSENIAEFLSDLKEQNKIIICTIHQPNSTVFAAFDRVLLLDKGGVQVYFGGSKEVFGYFGDELLQSENRKAYLETKLSLLMPDYFYDLIETPDRTGNRRFPPDYWERKYRNHRFRLAMDTQSQCSNTHDSETQTKAARKTEAHGWRNTLNLILRNFLNKSRSKINLIMTLFVAPLLSVVTSFVLRGGPNGDSYNFLANENSWLFGFISIIIFIFIGLANSIDDILMEKRSIIRELKLNISAGSQLISKHAVLLVMTTVQVLLYYIISAWILGMRGYFVPQSIFLLLSGITGYGLGLLFSSLIKDRSAIINILPLVIIPQIMFSGAVIQFDKMNSSLKLNHQSEIPEFCQLIQSRWLYEGWVIASARKNLLERHKDHFQKAMKDTNLGYAAYMQLVENHNHFLERHPEESYGNEVLKGMVQLAHGDYLNKGRNTFLSHRIILFGKERQTVVLDLYVSLAMILLSVVLTWIRLRFSFR
jgi:ABC-type multidrug transport system ATPase subunit/ABC-type multidrug transport system permease subunit